VAGTVIVEKIVGAAAERGDGLEALKALGERVNAATGTMGLALTPCIVPAAGQPSFTLGEGEIEMGVGIHGEPGRRREALRPADALAADLVGAIVESLKPAAGAEALLVVNGMGGTPLMELYLMADAALRQAAAQGLAVTRTLVGNWCTSLEMQGCSVTLSLLDAETTALWDAPVHTAALRRGL
jgi:dihydroxyacetone kinase-like protein